MPGRELNWTIPMIVWAIRYAKPRSKKPYMLIISDREVKSTSLSLRLRTGEDLGSIGIESFIRRVRYAITTKEGI